MITAETVRLFEEALRKKAPDLKIRYKDESLLMRAIGTAVYPFNPDFSSMYITTLGSTIYFPNRAFLKADYAGAMQTIAHEFVHIWDSKRDGWYNLKYAFPQVLGLVPLLAYGVLAGRHAWVLLLPLLGYLVACHVARRYTRSAFVALLLLVLSSTLLVGWLLTSWKLSVLLGLVAVAPWPAPWRTHYELRGYGMSVAFGQWLTGKVPQEYMRFVGDTFDGPAYYFMCRDRVYVDRTIEATRQQAEAGALQRVSPYAIVYDFLYEQGLLYRPT